MNNISFEKILKFDCFSSVQKSVQIENTPLVVLYSMFSTCLYGKLFREENIRTFESPLIHRFEHLLPALDIFNFYLMKNVNGISKYNYKLEKKIRFTLEKSIISINVSIAHQVVVLVQDELTLSKVFLSLLLGVILNKQMALIILSKN